MREKTEIKLIAFDLDYTLLDSNKELPAANRDAILRAAAAGIEIVPATGRAYGSIPEVVKELPIHYAITINGAIPFDVRKQAAIAHTGLNRETALEVMRYLKTLPVIYNAVLADDCGYIMSKEHLSHIEDYFDEEPQIKIMQKFLRPVDDVEATVRRMGYGVNKIVSFTLDRGLIASLLRELPARFPGTAISSSYDNNVEINDEHANKGEALVKLAEYLKIDMSQTMAFGDGLNDISMLRAAGIGVAMGNACEEVRSAADFVTLSCDESGMAVAIEKFCFGSE